MSVRCGFHGKDVVRHETATDVQVCAKLHYEAKAGLDTEPDYYIEDEDGSEAFARMLERRSEAYGPDDDEPVYDDERAAERAAALSPEEDTAPPAPSNRDRYAAWRRIPVHPDYEHGFYALGETDETIKFYRVERSSKGQYRGRTYVKVLASDVAHKLPFAEAGRVLDEIAKDPDAAGILFAEKTDRCRDCKRRLTVKASRDRGRGPDCAKKH